MKRPTGMGGREHGAPDRSTPSPTHSLSQASGQDNFSPLGSAPVRSHLLKCRSLSPQQICIDVARGTEICMVAVSLAISYSARLGQHGHGKQMHT